MANLGIETGPRVKLPPPRQLGIVVHDIERAIEFYSSVLGWGPFQTREVDLEGLIYRGRPNSVKLKVAVAQVGPVQIELIQVLKGETPYAEFLRRYGEGVQHLGFDVKDLDAILNELAKDGIEPVIHHKLPELDFAFVSGSRLGGLMLELKERRSK